MLITFIQAFLHKLLTMRTAITIKDYCKIIHILSKTLQISTVFNIDSDF